MPKNNSTKSARALAKHVRAILTHPDTPSELYDSIAEPMGVMIVENLKSEDYPIEVFELALAARLEEGGE